jgi:hypothetical protein
MPTISRVRSLPAGKNEPAYESKRTADNADNAQNGSDLKDQIVCMSGRPSTWLRAPAPVRFVRKQNKEEVQGQLRSSNISSAEMGIECVSRISATVEIDPEVWTFANTRNSMGRTHTLSTQSKFYLAHRQYVAVELTKADMVPTPAAGDTCNELWDGFLRVLSV